MLFGRVLAGRNEKSLLLTGLRGVGKTVLLNEIERLAVAAGYRTILVEAHEGKPLGALLAPHLRRLLFELDRLKGAGDKARRGLGVLRSFVGAIKLKVGELDIGLDIEPEPGVADSGDLEADLPDLLASVAEAAHERGVGVALLIDEAQYFSAGELSALIMADAPDAAAASAAGRSSAPACRCCRDWPANPSRMPNGCSPSPSSARCPSPTRCGRLQDPVRAEGAEFEPAALHEIFRLTQGYPYFLQEWGYQAWNHAQDSPIGPAVIREASEQVARRLDENFFRVRFDRLTPREKTYLRAMAELGAGPYRTGDIAERLGIEDHQPGAAAGGVDRKGMVYSPSHGEMAFTVPLFDAFMRRAMPTFER
ncbi:MAG: ATP-binding protein [Comamonadaceae bacterium]|nr:ATP-binding protein [Comamonadaceae bacterium]